MIDELLEANRSYARDHSAPIDALPIRHLAVVTCMDTRIDVLRALGLELGEAHILRNAGGRVTDDVLRSLALATHVLGVDTVAVMQHTDCGAAGPTNQELARRTGAEIDFLPIHDHGESLAEDVGRILTVPWLDPVRVVAGLLFDVRTGMVQEVIRRGRE